MCSSAQRGFAFTPTGLKFKAQGRENRERALGTSVPSQNEASLPLLAGSLNSSVIDVSKDYFAATFFDFTLPVRGV